MLVSAEKNQSNYSKRLKINFEHQQVPELKYVCFAFLALLVRWLKFSPNFDAPLEQLSRKKKMLVSPKKNSQTTASAKEKFRTSAGS